MDTTTQIVIMIIIMMICAFLMLTATGESYQESTRALIKCNSCNIADHTSNIRNYKTNVTDSTRWDMNDITGEEYDYYVVVTTTICPVCKGTFARTVKTK